jgi:hypothetical protein
MLEKDGEENLWYDGDKYQEAPVPEQTGMGMDVDDSGDDQQGELGPYQAQEARWAVENKFQKIPVVEPFSSIAARAPIANVCAVLKYESY